MQDLILYSNLPQALKQKPWILEFSAQGDLNLCVRDSPLGDAAQIP